MASQAETTTSAAAIPSHPSCFQANSDTHPCKWAAARLFVAFAEPSLIYLCTQPPVNVIVPSTALGDVSLRAPVIARLDNVHSLHRTSSRLEFVTAEVLGFFCSRFLCVATCCFAVCQSSAWAGI